MHTLLPSVWQRLGCSTKRLSHAPLGVLAAILLLCAQGGLLAMDLRPYAGPTAVLDAVDAQLRLKLWRSITVEAYTSSLAAGAVADADTVAALEAAAADMAETPLAITKEKALATARKSLSKSGNKDCRLAWAVFQLTDARNRQARSQACNQAMRVFREAALAKPDAKPPFSNLIAVSIYGHCLGTFAHAPKAAQAQALGMAKMVAQLMAGVIRDQECLASPTSLIRMCHSVELPGKDAGEAIITAVEAALAEAKTEPWLANTAKASLRIHNAWAWRGGGWANTVEEEGWKGFKSNLAEADRLLTEAFAAKPQEPWISALGITVARAGDSTTSADTWFQRCLKACFDFSDAYDSRLYYLLPRWGGSHQAMLEFGCDCVDTERFDTDVPMMLVNAVQLLINDANQMKTPEAVGPALADARVVKTFLACLDGYAKTRPEKAAVHTSLRAAFLWLADKRAEASAALAGVRIDTLDARVAKNFNVSFAEIQGAPAEAPPKDAPKANPNF